MNVLVTGAEGFIGINLVARLEQMDDVDVFKYSRDDTWGYLQMALDNVDFVFHIAGVNRPKDPAGFQADNVDFTQQIVDYLVAIGSDTPILFTSSIQTKRHNQYGESKRQAENIINGYVVKTGAAAYIYRLSNVFGKWGRPNYNSVVATWCYNISRGLPIQINDPSHVLELLYIDDVIDAFVGILSFNGYGIVHESCYVSEPFRITLQELADKLHEFHSIRVTGIIPDMNDPLTRFLYATYLSYLDPTDFSYPATMRTDDRGWLFELLKSPNIGQIFISQTKPGITRGGHYHNSKSEKFVVVQGSAAIKLYKVGEEKPIEYLVSDSDIQIVDIPPGYMHEITNTGDTDVITIFWANELFDPQNPDTYRLEQ